MSMTSKVIEQSLRELQPRAGSPKRQAWSDLCIAMADRLKAADPEFHGGWFLMRCGFGR